MINLKNLVGKCVICLSSAKKVGKSLDIIFDGDVRFAEYILLVNEHGTRYIPLSAVRGANDAVIVDGELFAEQDVNLEGLKNDMLNEEVYLQNGTLLGHVTDVEMTNDGRVQRVVLEGETFTPAQILRIGDVIIKKVARKSIPRPKEDYPVYALKDEDTNDLSEQNAVSVPEFIQFVPQSAISLNAKEPQLSESALAVLLQGENASFKEDEHTPARIISDYQFLLGRTLNADLFTYSGELIAPKGGEVTKSVVERARSAGKLVELTLGSSKTM